MKIIRDKDISNDEKKEFHQSFQAYNESYVGKEKTIPLNYCIHKNGKLVAAVLANIFWDWVNIETIFLTDDAYDNVNKILCRLENDAIELDIRNIAVRAILPEEQFFLQKYGFQVNGVLTERPPGFNCQYLIKEAGAEKIEKTIKIVYPTNEEIDRIRKQKNDLLDKRLGKYLFDSFHIFAKEKECLLGGITGYIGWDYLYISVLWVSAKYRRKGLGKELLIEAENFALSQNIKNAFLGTTDFQAKDFYLKQGYEIFAVRENFPLKYRNYSMKKNLENYYV